jgi:hypothetical protein
MKRIYSSSSLQEAELIRVFLRQREAEVGLPPRNSGGFSPAPALERMNLRPPGAALNLI